MKNYFHLFNKKNNSGETPIFNYFNSNNIDINIVDIFIKNNVDLNVENIEKNNILHFVCLSNNIDKNKIKYLVNMKCDVNKINNNKITPIFNYALNNKIDLKTLKFLTKRTKLEFLIQNNILLKLSQNKKINAECISFMINFLKLKNINQSKILNNNYLKNLFENNNFIINKNIFDESYHFLNGNNLFNEHNLFHVFCSRKKIEDTQIINFLFDKKADPNKTNKFGITPFYYLCKNNHPIKIFKLF